MNILQKIFKDHYEEIEYILHPRPVVMQNIKKMVQCGDPSYGGAIYGCPSCGEFKHVPFRCHSKFCPTCGNKYSIDRGTKIAFKLIRCNHRHLVFTIDEELRQFFLDDRSFSTACFRLSVLFYWNCFANSTSPGTLFLGSFAFFTHSEDPSYGTLTSIASLRKAASLMMAFGEP